MIELLNKILTNDKLTYTIKLKANNLAHDLDRYYKIESYKIMIFKKQFGKFLDD